MRFSSSTPVSYASAQPVGSMQYVYMSDSSVILPRVYSESRWRLPSAPTTSPSGARWMTGSA